MSANPDTSLQMYLRTEDGQDLLEYALLAFFIAVIAIAAIALLGNQILSVLWNAINTSYPT